MSVRVSDPFGLVELGRTFRTTVPLTVTPRTVPLPHDPARRRLDRVRRQPAARLRDRQRRGRHRPRVPPRRRPAPGPLAQLGPGRRADGAPRGAAVAVARHAVPRQPASPPTAARASPRSLEAAVSAAASIAVHLTHRGFTVRLVTADRRGAAAAAWHSAAPTSTPVPCSSRWPSSSRPRSPALDTGWLAEPGHGGLVVAVFGAVEEADLPGPAPDAAPRRLGARGGPRRRRLGARLAGADRRRQPRWPCTGGAPSPLRPPRPARRRLAGPRPASAPGRPPVARRPSPRSWSGERRNAPRAVCATACIDVAGRGRHHLAGDVLLARLHREPGALPRPAARRGGDRRGHRRRCCAGGGCPAAVVAAGPARRRPACCVSRHADRLAAARPAAHRVELRGSLGRPRSRPRRATPPPCRPRCRRVEPAAAPRRLACLLLVDVRRLHAAPGAAGRARAADDLHASPVSVIGERRAVVALRACTAAGFLTLLFLQRERPRRPLGSRRRRDGTTTSAIAFGVRTGAVRATPPSASAGRRPRSRSCVPAAHPDHCSIERLRRRHRRQRRQRRHREPDGRPAPRPAAAARTSR